jgi:hypothetical protein
LKELKGLKGFGFEKCERFVGFEGFSESKLAQGASKALVFGIWFLIFGTWNLVFGIWNLVLEFGTWNLKPGTQQQNLVKKS